MDRYGLASGKRINDTIADKELEFAGWAFQQAFRRAVGALNRLEQRPADREVKDATRRLVRAALDVERQRCFEKGIEAFAAMPMVRARHDEGRSNRWTPGTYCGE